MIFALDTLDPTIQGIFFLVAVVCFVIAAFARPIVAERVNLVAAGLAFFAFVFMYNAFALS